MLPARPRLRRQRLRRRRVRSPGALPALRCRASRDVRRRRRLLRARRDLRARHERLRHLHGRRTAPRAQRPARRSVQRRLLPDRRRLRDGRLLSAGGAGPLRRRALLPRGNDVHRARLRLPEWKHRLRRHLLRPGIAVRWRIVRRRVSRPGALRSVRRLVLRDVRRRGDEHLRLPGRPPRQVRGHLLPAGSGVRRQRSMRVPGRRGDVRRRLLPRRPDLLGRHVRGAEHERLRRHLRLGRHVRRIRRAQLPHRR